MTGLGFSIFPQLSFPNFQKQLNYKELIGKGDPMLLGKSYQLREDVHLAFLNMASAARKSKIKIQVVSSYRSFERQNQIWERKFKRNNARGLSPTDNIKKIIEYSTIPGTSRHHWGTDVDIIDANATQPSSVLQPKHFEAGGSFRKLKLWMDEHANSFGFYLVYTNIENRKGFNYEPWHYSYKPLSKNYLKAYLKLNLKDIVLNENLMGAQYFSKDFLQEYLNGNIMDINPDLL
mgnify:CR=1 FL=1